MSESCPSLFTLKEFFLREPMSRRDKTHINNCLKCAGRLLMLEIENRSLGYDQEEELNKLKLRINAIDRLEGAPYPGVTRII